MVRPACPFDTRTDRKEDERCTNYSEMRHKIAKIWNIKKVEVMPKVI